MVDEDTQKIREEISRHQMIISMQNAKHHLAHARDATVESYPDETRLLEATVQLLSDIQRFRRARDSDDVENTEYTEYMEALSDAIDDDI